MPTAEGTFPKCSGDGGWASELNTMYAGGLAGVSAVGATTENAFNIAKLQYCSSLTDVSHDYMIVDIFTQNCGYNTSVCVASTTSCFNSSALNGYYDNRLSKTVCPSVITCTGGGSGPTYHVVTAQCYGMCATSCANGTNTAEVCVCTGSQFSLTGVKQFCFNAYCFASNYAGGYYTCTLICITGSHDNFCVSRYSCADQALSVTNCYCYTCISSGCYCFYCNGAAKCAVSLTALPNIDVCICAASTCQLGVTNTVQVCYSGFCVLCDALKIQTNNVVYANPIKTVFYNDERFGTGTITYNVINATTGCCLCTGLVANCLYTMTCCVACHRYEIIQCNDNISCIKSYAIVVGKA